MNVTVFVPTCRRPGPLVWSLSSVLLQRLEGLDGGRARAVVLNNDAEAEPVERAVARTLSEVGATPWEVQVVHRRPPVDPLINWFGGILEFAADGDAVFLHSDDDLLVPDSVAVRAAILRDAPADLLLTCPMRREAWFDGPEAAEAFLPTDATIPRAVPRPWQRLAPGEVTRYGTGFIGNHAYRMTTGFRKALATTRALMDTVPLEGTAQRGQTLYFLPVFAADAGGVVGADVTGVLRGQSRHDVFGATTGQLLWPAGVLYAQAVYLLERGELGPRSELAPLRAEMQQQMALWYVRSLANPRTRDQLRRLEGLSPWRFGRGDARFLARGALEYIKARAGLTGWRARHGNLGHPVGRAAFFARSYRTAPVVDA